VFGEVDWHDFVTYCRSGICGHRGSGSYYDVVYGPVSTITGEWWKYEQLSFHTTPAINQLSVVAIHLGNPRFT
jgi:hypothetical protein